ncbi:NADH-quinone oxidoreductase subunit L [Terricaulis silvestris]|uniref:NADH-ubiquinone oxidoreductase chain 5 n=1 Tax=Terricaulis silvestris TaxID=2686094 RepID=A0A6I6MPC7_9CAUL|nr:NADH-quinone oxidoreductase subunit L [Terricaulis silvestris]QGZ95228.1 NADH-quinone oxidoreductase subunit 12 [Terricaulis silvestris]
MQFSPEVLIVLGPLFAAAFAGLLQRYIGDKIAMAVTTGSVGLSLALSLPIFADFVWGEGHARLIELFTFIDVGGFTSTWSVRIDALSAVMLVVVNTVSFLVHVYSIGYMAEDPHKARFFSYLSFFTFSMLALVTANDFLQLFFGWEGVGVASYLLIGFWFHKRSANDAAIKAFITNRVGDFGFALGVMAAFFCYGSIQFNEVFHAAAANPDLMLGVGAVQFRAVEVICVLLFIGAMGKSAQFFLHVWLPDAMEGPTPVSALIHAATMVTAGVFMVSRCGELYHLAPLASGFVTVVGATTALFAATVGLAQNDIKRVVAYSTCSQLGYMFFAAGVGAYNAAMFHLFTHAFFKALLFLGAGSVITGLHHEQDMRYMGGVRKSMPITWALMTIGTLALIGFGIPGLGGFAGFYSKDAIIEAAYGSHGIGGQFAFWCGVTAALLTSFYSWRLAFMIFEGMYRGNPNAHHDDHAHAAHDDHGLGHDDAHAKPADRSAPAHESPWVMLVPLMVLAAGAIAAGFLFAPYFLGEHAEAFWDHAVPLTHGEHDFPAWVIWAPLTVTVTGFLLAVVFYLFNTGAAKAMARGPVWAFLYNKWYFDELYDFIFVKGSRAIGDLFWKVGDQKIIDGLGPDGVATTSRVVSRGLKKVQSGFVYHYSFIMLIAAVAFGAYAIFAGIGDGR